MLQATIANVNRGKRQRPYKPEQFMPQWGRAKQAEGPLTGEELLEKIKKMNGRMGGR
jgi:hypothetical protein